jgi:hypothetical protein
VDCFYADVLGSLQAWSAAPPKLREPHPTPPDVDETVPAALTSTDYSSQDAVEDDDREVGNEPFTPSAFPATTPPDPPDHEAAMPIGDAFTSNHFETDYHQVRENVVQPRSVRG